MEHAAVMSEQAFYSTKDGLMLIVGLKALDKPPGGTLLRRGLLVR